MRTYLLTMLMLGTTLTGFTQQKHFTLKGKIKGQTKGVLKLSYNADGKSIVDSAVIKNGAFEFKGLLGEPVYAYFSGDVKSRGMADPNATAIFIEPAMMTMEVTAGAFENLKLTGSQTQKEYVAQERLKEPVKKELKPISAAYQQANEEYMVAIKAKKPESELEILKEKATDIKDQMDPFYDKYSLIDLEYIKSHPDSYYAAYLLKWKVSSMPLAESQQYYRQLSAKVKSSSYGAGVLKEIKDLEGGSPGSTAAVFSVQDINGEQLSLADFKGKKYVLLDFWASWCVPCRKGNPHLLSLYSKYKEKGLEIVGISDDDSKPDAWKKAVEKDQIGVWKHVLRGLKITGNNFDKSADISEPFGIHSLPTKILIDKNGIIIGRYGGGGEGDAAMDQKLAEIFN